MVSANSPTPTTSMPYLCRKFSLARSIDFSPVTNPAALWCIAVAKCTRSQLFGLMEGYFNNSFPAMASLFAREKDLTVKELDELLEDTRKELSKGEKRTYKIPQGGNKKRK